MKVASLFSGCGGLDLGLSKAGHEIILQVEINPRCRQVLRHHFPGAALLPNVEAVLSLPKETEVVAAGFPCQDLSPESNTRRGLKGSKTSLVRHVFRLLRASKPVQWVVLENVPGLLDRIQNEPPVIGYVTKELESLGYSWAYRIINTAAFGDPQRRRRVFVVACLHGDPRDALLAEYGTCGSPCSTPCVLCWEMGKDLDQEVHAVDLECWRSGGCVGLMPTLTKSNGSRWMLITPSSPSPPGLLAIEDAERLQGFEAGHTWPCIRVEGDTKDLLPDSHERARFALVGDAVSVPVAWYVGKRIARPYSGEKYTDGHRDEMFPAELAEAWPRAAWRLRGDSAPYKANGLLTHGVVAEYPRLLPFTPLSAFLTAVRQGLSEADVRNYVRRLRDCRFELHESVQLKLNRTYGMKLGDFQAYPRKKESVVWASLSGWRPKWYPAILQSRAHASKSVLAEEEKGKTLVVFKGEKNGWSSLWAEQVVPWKDRCPEEISDKMDRPAEYARLVDWARAEYEHLCKFDEEGLYKDGLAGHVPPPLKRKLSDVCLTSSPSGHKLVGQTIEVYWPADNTFYRGQIESYNRRNKRPYKIFYPDDQTTEHLDLTQEQWKALDNPEKCSPPPAINGPSLSGAALLSPQSSQPKTEAPPIRINSADAGGLITLLETPEKSRSCIVESSRGSFFGQSTVITQACSEPVCAKVQQPDLHFGLQKDGSLLRQGLSSLPQSTPADSKEGSLQDRELASALNITQEHTSAQPSPLLGRALPNDVSMTPGEISEDCQRAPPGESPVSTLAQGASTGKSSEPCSPLAALSSHLQSNGVKSEKDELSAGALSADSAAPNLSIPSSLVSDFSPLLPSGWKLFTPSLIVQEAAWKTGLSSPVAESAAKVKRVRQPLVAKSKKVITEAALIKNPALDGVALVGREVRILDLQTRLWVCAKVESFDSSIGFRNTLPWLVRYEDTSAEYVNLCLDRCEILPLIAVDKVETDSKEEVKSMMEV